jgi:hypothetical protein
MRNSGQISVKGRTNERSMQQSYRNRLSPKPSSKILRTRVNTIVDFVPGVDLKKSDCEVF